MKYTSTLLNQVWAGVSSGLVLAGLIAVWGYPATTLTQLTAPPDPLLSPTHSSWFSSVGMLVCVPASLAGGALTERLGPRRTQLCVGPVLVLAYVGMVLAPLVPRALAPAVLLGFRVVQGLTVALLYPSVHSYPCEVAEPRYRGALGGLIQTWASLGYLLCYVLGRYLTWDKLALVLPSITLVPGLLGLSLAQESPLWLARRGGLERAELAMECLRSSKEEACTELMMARQSLQRKVPWHQLWHDPQRRLYVSSLMVSIVVFVMPQYTGQIIISANAVRIFESAGVGLSPSLSSIVVATTRIVFCGIGSCLLHRVPRKTLLVCGNAVAVGALLSIAAFSFCQSRGYDVSWFSWLPLASLMTYMVAFSVGIGPASSLLHVEVLPGLIRSVGCSLAAMCFFTSIFLVTKTFDDMEANFGLEGVFLAYSTGCIAFMFFVLMSVPETRGYSLVEIEDIWRTRYGLNTPTENNDVTPCKV